MFEKCANKRSHRYYPYEEVILATTSFLSFPFLYGYQFHAYSIGETNFIAKRKAKMLLDIEYEFCYISNACDVVRFKYDG